MTKELFVFVLVLIVLLFLETTEEDNAVCLFFLNQDYPILSLTHILKKKHFTACVSDIFSLKISLHPLEVQCGCSMANQNIG